MLTPARVRSALRRRARGSRLLLAAGRAASVPVVLRSPLFDRGWYEAQVGRRLPGRTAAVVHYVRHGSRAGLSPCRLFEAEWYQPARWRSAPLDPFAHLLLRGRPDAQPHPLLDPLGAGGGARPVPEVLAAWLAAAAPTTPLPLPPAEGRPGGPSPATAPALGLRLPAGAAPVTWGALRAAQDDAVRRHLAQDRLRHDPRLTPAADRDPHQDALVAATWADAPLPAHDGPLVTVVMPVRDREAVVGRAVRSVLAQTLPSWELLVVDDGSRDGTRAAVLAAAGGDPRVRVLDGPARGVAAARNAALPHGRGWCTAFLDSDNAWEPAFLRTAVATMHARHAPVAHAAARVVRAGGDLVRDLDAQAEHLAVRNHVDLNVLVVRSDLLAEVGGFDETLRRTVDYDLVWRLARRASLLHVPLVGVVYDDDRTGDRLSTTERRSWKEVVRRRHLVDWDALATTPTAVGTTSVLLVARRGWAEAWRAVTAALGDATADGRARDADRAVVVDAGGRPSVARLLGALALVDPRVTVLRTPDDVGVPLGLDLALAAATGDVAVLLAEDAEPVPGALAALRAALDDGAPAAGALLLDHRDLVVAAGTGGAPGAPEPLLADLPADDARRLGPVVAVPALRGEALAARTADLVAERCADPLLAGGGWDVDLSARLAARRGASPVLVTGAVVRTGAAVGTTRRAAPATRATRTDPAEVAADAAENGRRHGAAATAWAATTADLRRRADPRHRPAAVVTAEAPPRLRWAVRTAALAGPRGDTWGDRHFGRAVADALAALGQEVVVDTRHSLGRSTSDLDDVVLAVRGKVPLAPADGAVRLAWVISHPDLVGAEELAAYDRVWAASAAWAADPARGRDVGVLLQATDPRLFHPAAGEGDAVEHHDVLFVGSSRSVYRPVVRVLVEAGRDVAVYGGGWERFLPPGVLRGSGIDNAALSAAYRGAGLVLNDHWEDMRRSGFASNRLFDAAASGARVVSDHVEGLGDVVGPLVRTYADERELLALVDEGPAGFPPDAERARLGRRVGELHSFDARARVLLEGALAVRAGRPGRAAR
ncbi:glycosyltransferase [Pseudokineococcus lusitanus]|uniref:Glycosyl transferase family 2 n=1 Tax=Pseudokineococcus lusitanus TaxID=763993 RepID=A0A3N1G908_9ACTN|nr:glycosyltransferase [Pseudokineococcus lusitanus]ROP26704.1 glycosyl transferase family 2 [Pseudokineococcus lusitanus]